MKVYTRTGDDGTTGLLFGGRVRKDDPAPTAYGDVDEVQAAIGVARASIAAPTETDLDEILVGLARDLWIVMAELATLPENRSKLKPGASLVTEEMVTALEDTIDSVSTRFTPPTEFVIPGQDPTSAALDVARTVARRCERSCLAVAVDGSWVQAYMNRLSDVLWTLARWREQHTLTTRSVGPQTASS